MKRASTTTGQIEQDRRRKAELAEHKHRVESSKARAEIAQMVDAPSVERILVGDLGYWIEAAGPPT